jgi:hypothetical protein
VIAGKVCKPGPAEMISMLVTADQSLPSKEPIITEASLLRIMSNKSEIPHKMLSTKKSERNTYVFVPDEK